MKAGNLYILNQILKIISKKIKNRFSISFIFSVLFLFLSIINSTEAQGQNEKEVQLLQAAYDGNTSKVLQCLIDSSNINCYNEDGVTPLMYAAQQGHTEVVKVLLYNHANPNFTTSTGNTALILASENNYPSIVYELLLYGANINHQDKNGNTALMHAAALNLPYMADYLISNHADATVKANDSSNALITSVFFGNNEIANNILNKTSLTTGKDIYGHTPFSIAVMTGNKEMIDSLNKYNPAQVIQINKSGIKSPVDYARVMNQTKLIKDLRKLGYRGTVWPYFQKISVGYTVGNFSVDDFLMGFTLGCFDTKYGFHIEAGFNERMLRKRVLEKYAENISFQFWEKRRDIFIQLDKCFDLSIKNPTLRQGIFIGGKGLVSWGRYYGTSVNPKTTTTLVPRVGYFIMNRNFFLKGAYEYGKISETSASKHWLNISAGFFVSFKKNLIKPRTDGL